LELKVILRGCHATNISWASTIGLNWILGIDKVGDWATHRLSYALTKEYGITHGYALAMIYKSWAKIAYKYNKETMERRLSILGKGLFNGLEGLSVLDELDKLFSSWGASVRMSSDLSINDEDINAMVKNALALGNVGTVVSIDYNKAVEIFKLANEVL
jgi:alcohol dehydrogenase YqhD (iron-dependent ADH family)